MIAARVFRYLSDGRFHSGEDLARELAVTRSAIWKATSELRSQGVEIFAVRNRGYRLKMPCEPLEEPRILQALSPATRERLERLEVAWVLASTNDELLARQPPRAGTACVVLAEHQSAGRGRRGRAWLAPPGGAICLSLSWTFAESPRDLSALSLVVGVCLLRALRGLGARNLELKWPNDVLCEHRKLVGVLIELRAESAGPTSAVIGIGINCALGSALRKKIGEAGLAPADLVEAGLAGRRNEVAAAVLESCIRGLQEFQECGARGFREEWQRADALRDRTVTLHFADGASRGVARGVDLAGALLVETPEGVRRYLSGDITVRFDT
jgi:BirA family transcriptional regulator, biotin operon repressor / biotin---[acetyl-CoA-carboxylase] ligase